MYLKRLELAGFKTFADRTDLEFHPGVTAIVGPNGSGKSNLCEAIRWVLGEQSAHALRGTRTEDFIFAGSAKRRAHGLAQVSLTLDNTEGHLPLEFTEISVMRRATRGGEGEFFLNGLPCRLRDIQMLFLGTGLGGRSYALIGQGEVDAVLNASSQERRLLLEEAAGLARYKRRRQESLRRLEHTAAHLQRIGDLLAELQSQHVRLAEQAEAARQHRAHTEEVRTIERALVADEARRLRQALARYSAQMETSRARLSELQTKVEAARREAAGHLQAREDLSRSWEARQRELVGMVRAQAAAESAVERAESRLAAHRHEQERLRAEAARLGVERDGIDAALSAIRAAGERLAQEARAAQGELEAHAAALTGTEDAATSEREGLEALQQQRTRLVAAAQEIAGELTAVGARRQVMERQHVALVERRRRLDEHLAAAVAEESRVRERVGEAQAALDRLGRRYEEVAAGARRLEGERDAAADEVRAAETRHHRLESRLQALEEAGARMLGYEEGARTLLLAKQADPGRFGSIIGALVDHIEVKPRFQAAVEAALGRRLFCLLTTGTDILRDALAYVRADGRGPVSFLPLDRLAPRHPNGEAPPAGGVLGSASGFVTADGRARKAVEALLGDVLVVENLDVALRLLAAGYRGRAVTLQGELVSPDGVISVRGATNGGGSPLTRRGDLDTNRRDLQEAVGLLADRRARQGSLERDVGTLRTEMSALEQERSNVERSLAEAEAALAIVTRERARLPVEVEEVAGETAALSGALEELRARTAALAQEARRTDAAVRDLGAQTAERERAVAGQAAVLDDQRRAGEDIRVRLAELEARRQARAAREQDFIARRNAVQTRCLDVEAADTALGAQTEERMREVAAARDEGDRVIQEQAGLQAQLETLEGERAARGGAATTAQEAAVAAEEEARTAEASLHRTELRATQAEGEWGAVERRLAEIGLGPTDVEQLMLPLPRDEARGRLEALRGLIASLGAVNLRAIDEQEALAVRIDRIARQVADIEGARTALAELLARLDAVLRVRFRDTFAAVNEEFGRLFLRLFEGGAAHLELVEETPEAEPGLEVLVRLPGKPVRPLAALSGGERVLVALALLFSMLRVHPSPFCVFDEVEAALDDANTRRFTTLLRELASSTQIIIVTHNKGTMEASDILYGVTMQEPGISAILSVRLGERQRSPDDRRETVTSGR